MAPKAPAKAPVKPARTLADFLLAKRRVGCPICELSAEIREQLKAASSRGIRRGDQIEWLQTEHRVTLTRAMFDAHHSGRHEQA